VGEWKEDSDLSYLNTQINVFLGIIFSLLEWDFWKLLNYFQKSHPREFD
jgi:hypothetical protein